MTDKREKKRPPSARKLLDIVGSHCKRAKEPDLTLSELSLNLLTDRGDRQLLAEFQKLAEQYAALGGNHDGLGNFGLVIGEEEAEAICL